MKIVCDCGNEMALENEPPAGNMFPPPRAITIEVETTTGYEQATYIEGVRFICSKCRHAVSVSPV